MQIPFSPAYGSGQSLSGTSGTAFMNKSDRTVRVANVGTVTAFVRTSATTNNGGVPIAATANDYCIPAGVISTFNKNAQDGFSFYGATAVSLQIMTGNGGF
jgi:hypothetical protein